MIKQIKKLHIQGNNRGKRGGRCHNYKTTWDYNQGINEDNQRTLPQVITTVVQNERISNDKQNTLNLNNIIEIKPQSVRTSNKHKNLKICSINPRSVKNNSYLRFYLIE